MTQLDLYRHKSSPAPYAPGRETSRDAARAIEPHAGQMREQVLAYLRRVGSYGATDEEIQRVLGLSPNTARPRRVDLVRSGLVCDSGRTRATASGRKATVWVVA
mgnify:CR=1 FL=1